MAKNPADRDEGDDTIIYDLGNERMVITNDFVVYIDLETGETGETEEVDTTGI